MIYDRMPPNAIECERAVLGCMLINQDTVFTAVDILGKKKNIFYQEAHQLIYEAILACVQDGTPLDMSLLLNKLQNTGRLEQVGGPVYIADLTGAVPTSANVEHYAETVRDKAMARLMITRVMKVMQQAYGGSDIETLLAELELAQTGLESREQSVVALNDFVGKAAEDMISSMETHGLSGLQTGFAHLDNITGGFVPGDLIILAARPSVGKTAFALNLALSVARIGHGVMFFSLEMSRAQLARRLLHHASGITQDHLASAAGSGQKHTMGASISKGLKNLWGLPLYVDDTPQLTPHVARMRLRRHMAKHDIKLVVLDYLQFMKPSQRAESRRVGIDAISADLKSIAKEMEVPVIALCQLSREAEKEEPRLSHLKESGGIEQDADVVILLSESKQLNHGVFVNIAKQRNRGIGSLHMLFHKEFQRFEEPGSNGLAQTYIEGPDGDPLGADA